jgi:hypothetical protein
MTERKQHDTEKTMMRDFVISHIHEILLERSNNEKVLGRACNTNMSDNKYIYNKSLSWNTDFDI